MKPELVQSLIESAEEALPGEAQGDEFIFPATTVLELARALQAERAARLQAEQKRDLTSAAFATEQEIWNRQNQEIADLKEGGQRMNKICLEVMRERDGFQAQVERLSKALQLFAEHYKPGRGSGTSEYYGPISYIHIRQAWEALQALPTSGPPDAPPMPLYHRQTVSPALQSKLKEWLLRQDEDAEE